MNPETLQLKRLLKGVTDPGTLRWSPDNRWLAYTSEAGNGAPQGVWLFSLQTGTPTLIHTGHYRDVAWSPNGRTLFTVECTNDICSTADGWKYDVSALVAPVQ